ncbi:MAG: DUF1207 domain-containing protein [Chloroherpetonaceae bacterium]
MRLIKLCFLLLFSNIILLKADFIEDPLVKPFAANIYEARIGMLDYTSDNYLRLDIGSNFDLYHKTLKNNLQFGIGTEFFTYTRLRSESSFKFPVETIDYYFGGNLTFLYPSGNNNFQGRLRIGHISTHLADGYTDNRNYHLEGEVIIDPIVYSREFIDLTFAVENSNFRPYIGVIYNFHKIPSILNMFIPQVGFDGKIKINDWLNIVGGLDFKLSGYNGDLIGMTDMLLGIEFRTAQNRSILIKGDFYTGESYFGQFYEHKIEHLGLGFQFNYY